MFAHIYWRHCRYERILWSFFKRSFSHSFWGIRNIISLRLVTLLYIYRGYMASAPRGTNISERRMGKNWKKFWELCFTERGIGVGCVGLCGIGVVVRGICVGYEVKLLCVACVLVYRGLEFIAFSGKVRIEKFTIALGSPLPIWPESAFML